MSKTSGGTRAFTDKGGGALEAYLASVEKSGRDGAEIANKIRFHYQHRKNVGLSSENVDEVVAAIKSMQNVAARELPRGKADVGEVTKSDKVGGLLVKVVARKFLDERYNATRKDVYTAVYNGKKMLAAGPDGIYKDGIGEFVIREIRGLAEDGDYANDIDQKVANWVKEQKLKKKAGA